jgi:manganese transport protein
VGACLAIEWWLADPQWGAVAAGLRPHLTPDTLYVAVGMLGATVMPHNLYLHSSLVQTRAAPGSEAARTRALRYNLLDTVIALNVAFCINAAILVVAADVFHSAGLPVTDLRDAQRLLGPLLGTGLAGALFAVALLCAGQSSTITGTLAGQVVMQGFLGLRGSPAVVRFTTRAIAVVPALIALVVFGEGSTVAMLVATQVVLSLQLPFALVPLVRMTADRRVMGTHASGPTVVTLAWGAALIVIACNAWLVVQTIGDRLPAGWMPVCVLVAAAALGLLLYLAFAPLRPARR